MTDLAKVYINLVKDYMDLPIFLQNSFGIINLAELYIDYHTSTNFAYPVLSKMDIELERIFAKHYGSVCITGSCQGVRT